MKCLSCNKEVELKPSATERAKKHGGTPTDYIKLFPKHAYCIIRENKERVSTLIRKNFGQSSHVTREVLR